MKFLITLTIFMASNGAYAFPQNDLDHMDLVDLTQSSAYELQFTVQYPGLGGGHHNAEDCLALIVGKRHVTEAELRRFSELVSVFDGSGALFGNGRLDINTLKPEILIKGKPILVFKLKDLGTYITGLRINNFTVYAGFRHSVKMAFGKTTGTTAFQFLRGCKL